MSNFMITRISEIERDRALKALPLWSFCPQRQALYRRISFATFADAMAAMLRIGFAAERADHHPEWSNVYNILDIWLTTHDVGGISERDFHLAHEIDVTCACLA